jgi:hypothetical protein
MIFSSDVCTCGFFLRATPAFTSYIKASGSYPVLSVIALKYGRTPQIWRRSRL